MAMPVRSSRVMSLGDSGQTPSTVGPGSYNVGSGKHAPRPLYTAFGCSANRSSSSNTNVNTPGPGAYSLDQENRHNIGAFRSKTARLPEAHIDKDIPGPGAYNLDRCSNRKAASRSAPGRRRHSASQASIAACGSEISVGSHNRHGSAPLVATRYNPPAIPCREQSYGYTEDNSGHVVPLPVPVPTHTGKRNDSVGPGQYNPDDSTQKPGIGGACFAKAPARRSLFDTRSDSMTTSSTCSPSVASESPTDRDRSLTTARSGGRQTAATAAGTASFLSTVDRLRQSIPEGPGPCDYAATPASIGQQGVGCAKNATRLQCFGSTSRRSVWLRNDAAPYTDPDFRTPGPGTYSVLAQDRNRRDQKTLFDSDAPQIGFGESSLRACMKPLDDTVSDASPGPAAYESAGVPLSLAHTVQQHTKVGRKGVFGASGDRWHVSHIDELLAKKRAASSANMWQTAPPAPRRVIVLHKPARPSSSFAKHYVVTDPDVLAERMPPAPTCYHVKGEFDKLSEQRQALKQQQQQQQTQEQSTSSSTHAHQARSTFGSSSKRSTQAAGVTHTTHITAAATAAAAYSDGLAIGARSSEHPPGPGPGKYCVTNHSISAATKQRRHRGKRILSDVCFAQQNAINNNNSSTISSSMALNTPNEQRDGYIVPSCMTKQTVYTSDHSYGAGPGDYNVATSMISKTHNVTFMKGRANALAVKMQQKEASHQRSKRGEKLQKHPSTEDLSDMQIWLNSGSNSVSARNSVDASVPHSKAVAEHHACE